MKKPVWLVLLFLLALSAAWVFVPKVRVWGYQSLLIVGPVNMRDWAVMKLGDMGAESLDNEDALTCARAAWALGEFGPAAKAVVPALKERVQDRDG